MARIQELKLLAVDLPFRKPFKHAAASRATSASLFLKCVTDTGDIGFGECLPREYVTGETRDSAFELLAAHVLPRLRGRKFDSFPAVIDFLTSCDGKAPADWVSPTEPQSAAWCAVDLALLDAFGRHFGTRVRLGEQTELPAAARYSVVVSTNASLKTLLLIRFGGVRNVKLKVEAEDNVGSAKRLRRILGAKCDIRADANMAWNAETALREMTALSRFGITSFEQPLPADDIDGLAEVVRESADRFDIMADESLSDRDSLLQLIERKACTAANVRISKCGGLIAAHRRCTEAIDAGLTLQIGCQVGESSLLSAAHLALTQAVPQARYLEGCFGKLLLRNDPVYPQLNFGFGGRPPKPPGGHGFGVEVDEAELRNHASRCEVITSSN